MRAWGHWRIQIVAAVLAATLAAWAHPATAAGPAHRFLNELRARGMYDSALLYLDQAETSRLVPDDFKAAVRYERGITLLALARRTEDPRVRSRRLSEAETVLEAYAKDQANDPRAIQARVQLADALLQRGRGLVERARRPDQEPRRETLLAKARGLFEQVRKKSEQSEKQCTELLKGLPKFLDPKTESAKIEQRDQLRSELLYSKLAAAAAVYEGARTYPPDSKEYTEQVAAAATRYREMYEKYQRTRYPLPALYAHLWEGQCYKDLGQPDKAIRCCGDLILESAEQPAVRRLVSKAVKLRGECWMAQGKFDQTIAAGKTWLDLARESEDRDPDWLAIKVQVATAHRLEAEAAGGSNLQRRRHVRETRVLAREVARYPSPYRQEAVALLAQTGAARERTTPKTFTEAVEAARESLDIMKTSKVGLAIARKNNPESVPKLQQQFEASRDAAIAMLQLALPLADTKTAIDQVNQARYYLCYLNWELGRYYDAAVFGQFLASRYPDASAARPAAKIALTSYQKLYTEPGNQDTKFEAGKLVDLAQLITKQWPGQADADDAYTILAGFAVEQGRWTEARQYVEKITPERRSVPLLKAGLGLWGNYLRRTRLAPEERPTKAELEQLKSEARSSLEQGLTGLKGDDKVTATRARAALSLAQIYLDSGEYAKAVGQLEEEPTGPLALVAARHPAASSGGFAEETYKAALRAYVSVQPPMGEKAQGIMDAMDQLVGKEGDTAAAERLTRIYISLGRQLQDQLERLRETGNQKELERVTQAFEALLDRVGKRQAGGDWASRNWVAQTFANLAAGLQQGRQLTPQSKAYYAQAVAAYDAILDEARQRPDFAPSDRALLAAMLRKAECLRHLGRFKESLDLFATLLGKKPNMLDAQMAAAQTYQQRGAAEDVKWYRFAWQGGRKDPKTGKNRIWGWAKIGQITARYEQYRNIFFDSRYKLVLCRVAYALRHKETTREKYLRMAKSDIRYTAELYPDLGGDASRTKFEKLLKRIQRELREDPVGFQEFGKRAQTTRPTTSAGRSG
jgi:hypothetical protein